VPELVGNVADGVALVVKAGGDGLAEDLSEKDCHDIVFAAVDGALWHWLVAERGWSDERFAEWLGNLWMSQLVKLRHIAESSHSHRTHARERSRSDTAAETYDGPIRHKRAERALPSSIPHRDPQTLLEPDLGP